MSERALDFFQRLNTVEEINTLTLRKPELMRQLLPSDGTIRFLVELETRNQ
jgi:hypothetical protein